MAFPLTAMLRRSANGNEYGSALVWHSEQGQGKWRSYCKRGKERWIFSNWSSTDSEQAALVRPAEANPNPPLRSTPQSLLLASRLAGGPRWFSTPCFQLAIK